MALSTLAEWTGSEIVSKLVDTALAYLGERMLPADIEEELTRLKTALPIIKAVMSVAEDLKMKHPNSGVDDWLNNFKEAFLAADDLLDELKYRELADKVKNQAQVSESSSSSHGFRKRKFPSTDISNATLLRLREVVKRLDHAVTKVDIFFQFASALQSQCLAQPNSSRETTSLLTESKVFGLENERAKIIKWFKKPASHAPISVFCIIGAGGLGKTTLAQLVYEEISKENYFDKIIWLCVSSFNVEEITRKILLELGERNHGGESLNVLQQSLKERIHSKKILLILDDVWEDNRARDWEILIAPLRFVREGSKILLTTRLKSVAELLAIVLNVDKVCLELKGLEEQELLSLLNKYAFYGFNPDNHKDLQTIGKDIVMKLWGSPLAAKVIGSLLNSNMDFNYWNRILKHDSLINLDGAKGVADILKLSYFHLGAELQECFRFCSIFPHDYEFEKDTLIRLWMASGLLRKQSCAEERPEDIGEKYFNHLLMKAFFEPFPVRENYYLMHDLVHELAQNVSEGECCRVQSNDKLVNIPSSTQHVYVDICNIKKVFHLWNLRTLIITMSEYKFDGPARYVLPIGSLKKTLRVLAINVNCMCTCKLPEEIGGLIHLRYLTITEGFQDFICRKIYELPRSICKLPRSIYKLHHLEVLEWYGDNFETVGITNLVSLRYMKLPKEMMQSIKRIHKLTSLQELTFFVGKERGYHIDELKTLSNLRILSIEQIENVREPIEAKNAILSEKEHLLSLSLSWTQGSDFNDPQKVIDNLQPNINLEELKIGYYSGPMLPIWMSNLPHLKILSLFQMDELRKMDYLSHETATVCFFPSLEKFYCDGLRKWESWGDRFSIYGFPNLKELAIVNCPRLAKLPGMPLSLVSFKLSRVGLHTLPDMCHNATPQALSYLKSSLRRVEVGDCPNLTSLNGFLKQENIDCTSIRRLHITNCDNLVQLPTGGFGKFMSLNFLTIKANPNLLAVDNLSILLPEKLSNLSMGNCGELDVQLLESASRLPTLSNLSIENSATVNCIPSSENAFTSLRILHIHGCDKLVEVSFKDHAHNVGPRSNSGTLKISQLDIDHLSLLLIEPIRSLRFVIECVIWDCSGMKSLPEKWLLQNSSTLSLLHIRNACSLRSLPSSMVMLTSLKELCIENAKFLKEIPKLPASLLYRSIEYGDEFQNLVENTDMSSSQKHKEIVPLETCDEHLKASHEVKAQSPPQDLNLYLGENGCNMTELKTNHNLRCLSIKNMELLVDPTEVKDAELSEKENLESLSLEWSPMSSAGNHEQILDNLQPHTNLLELVIKCYGGSRSPFWMMNSHLSSIRSLTLDNCTAWDHLPILGQMPLLETLNLFHMIEVKELVCSVGNMISGACFFPSLQRLHCCDMPKWKCWAGLENRCGFPKLTELVIEDCPNLIELPPLSLALGTFKILNLGIRALPNLYQSSGNTDPAPSILKSSLSVVEITACPNLKSLDGFLQQDNIQLQAIDELHIMDCENLVLLPIGGFAELTSLRVLTLEDNPKLKQLNFKNNLLPVNLQTLSVGNCGELDVTLVDSSSGLSTLFQLKMQNCANICSIPSETAFQSLCNLSISGCSKLVEFSTQGQRRGTDQGSISALSMLAILDIDQLSLLLIEPLRSIRSVMELIVWDCSGMEALPEEWLLQNCSTLQKLQINDASTLRSLPCSMLRLTHLETLVIDNAIMLEELPDLPASLKQKYIRGAHYL